MLPLLIITLLAAVAAGQELLFCSQLTVGETGPDSVKMDDTLIYRDMRLILGKECMMVQGVHIKACSWERPAPVIKKTRDIFTYEVLTHGKKVLLADMREYCHGPKEARVEHLADRSLELAMSSPLEEVRRMSYRM